MVPASTVWGLEEAARLLLDVSERASPRPVLGSIKGSERDDREVDTAALFNRIARINGAVAGAISKLVPMMIARVVVTMAFA